MNTVNLNISAPSSGLPSSTLQTTNSPETDASAEAFAAMMNSAAPGGTTQSKIVRFHEAMSELLNPNVDPVIKKGILADLHSEYQEMLNDPEFKQLMADNPDRAANLNRAAERFFNDQTGDPVAVMKFELALNTLVYGEPKLPDDPKLLGELREALDNFKNNPGDPVAVINLQMVMARLNGVPLIPPPEIAQKINDALDLVRANPGDAQALENLKRVMAEVAGKGSGTAAPAPVGTAFPI